MVKNIYGKRMLTALCAVAMWQGIYSLQLWPPYLFPSPREVFGTLQAGMGDYSLPLAVLSSFRRLLTGYILAVVCGAFLGVALAKWRWFQETAGFLILGLQSVPSIVWLPLSLLWFGLNDRAIIFVVVIGALWTMVISIESGIKGVPPTLVRAARTMGYGGAVLLFKVIFPASFPKIITGLRLSWAFAWRSLMAGELIGSGEGLGQVLMVGRNLGDMSLVIAVMLIIGVIGASIDTFIFQPAERHVLEKWGHV